MAYRGRWCSHKLKKIAKIHAKTHPECLKIGEFASEGRRRLMDDEQPGIVWEKYLKYKNEKYKIPLNLLIIFFHLVR